MTSDVSLWLCSNYEECQHDASRPLRLLDIIIHYEDHCKDVKTFLQSKDYLSKIIPTVFPSVQRTRIHRSGKKYSGFTGIREMNVASSVSSDAAKIHSGESGNIAIAVPSLHQKNDKQLFVVTTLREEVINIGLSDGTTLERIDGKLLDIPARNTVLRPEKAFTQLSKCIRVCRGVEIGEETGERWTSLIDKTVQHRVRAPACQNIVPWLSSGDTCSECKKLIKKQVKTEDSDEKENGIKCSDRDDNLLNTIIERASSGDGAQTPAVALLKAQLKNIDPCKDPRSRRWDPEVISLCLTLYCRSPRTYADLKSSEVLVLPSQRLLQYYKNSVDQAPGVNQRQLDWMVKEAVFKNVSNFGKRGGLVLDEMSIQDDIQIVRRGDSWVAVGMVDNGEPANSIDTIINQGNKTKMATHILQFVFQGFTGFRWPVAYFATDTATTHQLYINVWELIEQVESRGFNIDYVMMDGGSANRSLMSLILGENPRYQSFTTPNVFDFTKSISFVQDIKHCFKKIRNGIESSRMAHQFSNKGRFLKVDGQPIVWDHFESAFEFNTQSGLRIHRHLTREHVTLTPSNKMRNNLATQVLDKDMLYLMKAYQASLPQPEKLSSTVNLLENTSTLVDFFMDQNRPVCHKDSRLVEVEKALSFFNTWEASVKESRNLLSRECRDDLNSAVTGFTKLCERVLSGGDVIKPGYFNSDIVENFFCQQRGIRNGNNTNPTVLQYGPAVNAICLGQTTVSRKNNSSTSAHYFKAATPGRLTKQ